MIEQLVVLSGHIACGKTTLAKALESRFGFRIEKTRILLNEALAASGRLDLQAAGETLDEKTHGSWIADALMRKLDELSNARFLVVDSVRIASQIEQLRRAFGPRVVHVHLTASDQKRRSRYTRRRDVDTFDVVMQNKTESEVETLSSIADIVIDTERNTAEDVAIRVASRLGFYGRGAERLVDVLVGGEYGSEGKGHVSSYLAREYSYLVRVGGPNAGHQVYEEDGSTYTFHHLPSGTRSTDAKIVLGAGAVVSLKGLIKEVRECRLGPDRLTIDEQVMIIEAADVRLEQKRLVGSIGSTGQGVGFATARKVLRKGARPPVRLAKDIPELRPFIGQARAIMDSAFAHGEKVFLEGTQGTGLSLHHGSYPFVTSRDTSVSGCLAEAGIAPSRVRRIVLVTRSYPIRVESPKGETSGPMAIELSWAEISRRSGISVSELRKKERTSTTHRKRRVGEFEWELFRRSVSLNGPTDIALTFADYIRVANRNARRFEQLTPETINFVEELERVATAPVSLITTRFHSRSIIDRRNWR